VRYDAKIYVLIGNKTRGNLWINIRPKKNLQANFGAKRNFKTGPKFMMNPKYWPKEGSGKL
jgi:hypothetical protein